MINYKRLREVAQAATPGPWIVPDLEELTQKRAIHRGEVIVEERSPGGIEHIATAYCGAYEGHGLRNAAYIASASPDVVLGMLDRIERLEEALMKYGSHYGHCDLGDPCSCGLDAALDPAPSDKEPK